ncbi:MAG: peptidoglycan-binding protein [Candidatus Liptonbacteria bacterium]|nr:peptidoglycan-binding protein [Candidatus Liptonbacteria bacterium]
MSTFGKKFVSLALMTTVAVWASGALLFVPVASAQSSTDLQAQIAQLLAQIAQLQGQLSTGSTNAGPSMSTPAYNFTRNLTVGNTGADVKALQQWLNGNGYTVAQSGAGSAGNETTYFGPATKKAVAAFQAAKGITPVAGYFGPITRGAVAAMAPVQQPVQQPVEQPVQQPVAGQPVEQPVQQPVANAPASGLSVGLSAQNPGAGSLISSSASAAARVPVLSVNLTAGIASGITVTQLKFHKTGVISDSSISGAYVEESGKVLAQYTSISGGTISFPGMALNIAAGQTKTLTLSIDPAQNLSAGNTVGFAMAGTSDVTAIDATGAAVTPSGGFPLNGNTFTVTSVSNPSIASLTIASSSIGTTVYSGSKNSIVGAWSFTGSNSKIWLKGLNLKVIGSANKADLQNVKLYVNGSQVGQTLAAVPADGGAYFDLTAAPATINTGANNVQVYADVMGSPNFNFQFEILNSYDVLAVDSQYNVPVSAASNVGTQVSINAGTLTVTVASNTPTGNLAGGQTGVTLAKYSVYAAGEPVKVKWLTFSLTLTGAGTTSTLDSMIKNMHLDDDAGGQVGTTISSLMTTATCGSGAEAFSAATSSPVNCFGSSGSPINYIIPANTTRILSLKGDIQSGANFSTMKGSLVAAAASNLQGLISSASASSGAASGSALTLSSSALTVAKNTSVGTLTVSKGATNVRVGSYAFSASSAEGVTVSNLTVLMGAAGADFQNLAVKIGSSQFGSTQSTLANAGSYSFSGTPFTVPAGGTTYVDVYADVLSGATAGTDALITTLSGCSGSGASSLTAVSCTSTGGQSANVAGQSTITVTLDNSLSPATGQIVMGSTSTSLAAFQFTETTNIEDIKITDLNIFQQVASTTTQVIAGIGSVKLYKSNDLTNPLATAGSAITSAATSTPGAGYYYTFHFGNPVIIPKSGSVSLVLKGDISSYSPSGAADNATHIFKIATSSGDSANDTLPETIVALGSTSNNSSSITLSSASGNTLTLLRTKLAVAAVAKGTTSDRSKSSQDDLGTITFTADSAGQVRLNTVTVTFSGLATSATTFLGGVNLLDANNQSVMLTTGVASTTSGTCDTAATCTKTWSLGTTTAGWQVTAGSSYTFTLRVDSTVRGGTASVTQGINARVVAATDVAYTDGSDSSASSNINLPATVVPLPIISASYVNGS